MTEQQITQAREDLEQLGIEQLRCGVMLQLLKIEELTKESDEYRAKYNECYLVLNDVIKERDALAVDVGRYRWLRRSATKLSFDNALIGSLVRDQAELDGAIQEAGVQ